MDHQAFELSGFISRSTTSRSLHRPTMQFEDADEDALQPALAAGQRPPAAPAAPAIADPRTPRAGATFVDDEAMPDEDEGDEDEYDEYGEDDEWDADAGLDEGLLAVMDQDWADAAGGAPPSLALSSPSLPADVS